MFRHTLFQQLPKWIFNISRKHMPYICIAIYPFLSFSFLKCIHAQLYRFLTFSRHLPAVFFCIDFFVKLLVAEPLCFFFLLFRFSLICRICVNKWYMWMVCMRDAGFFVFQRTGLTNNVWIEQLVLYLRIKLVEFEKRNDKKLHIFPLCQFLISTFV